ncbi:hypothetical protein OF83DRAFT_1087071, partial [Amylostereum chailletii]
DGIGGVGGGFGLLGGSACSGDEEVEVAVVRVVEVDVGVDVGMYGVGRRRRRRRSGRGKWGRGDGRRRPLALVGDNEAMAVGGDEHVGVEATGVSIGDNDTVGWGRRHRVTRASALGGDKGVGGDEGVGVGSDTRRVWALKATCVGVEGGDAMDGGGGGGGGFGLLGWSACGGDEEVEVAVVGVVEVDSGGGGGGGGVGEASGVEETGDVGALVAGDEGMAVGG